MRLLMSMKKRQVIIAGVLLIVVIASSLFVIQKQPGLPRIPGRHRTHPEEHVAIDDSCLNNHFPDSETRHRLESSDVWQCNYTEPHYDFPQKTFLMLKTGAEVMWERLPVHFFTTLKRYPHHALYSDGAGRVGGVQVVDTLAELPDEIMKLDQLSAYRAREKARDYSWGWSADEIKADGGWENDKYKNVPMLLHAWQTAPSELDWFMFIDDDTFMVTESIAELVKPYNPKDRLYFGSPAISGGAFPESGRVGERLKAESPSGHVDMPFAHGGTGVIISRGALDAAFGGKSKEELKQLLDTYAIKNKLECCGDAMVAYMLREETETYLNAALPELYSWPYGGETLSTTKVRTTDWCLPLRSFHHLKSWEIDVLHKWEGTLYERRRHLARDHHSLGNDDPTPLKHPDEEHHDREFHHMSGTITHSDFYRDFVLPYISEEREGWEIFPDKGCPEFKDDTDPITTEEGRVLRPASDREHCKEACVANSTCLGWQWLRGECKLEMDGVAKGRAVNDLYKKYDGRIMWSGYLLDRVLKARADAWCDPYNDEVDQSDESTFKGEGWYLRMLEDERENQRHKEEL